jgi:hypothetical protein
MGLKIMKIPTLPGALLLLLLAAITPAYAIERVVRITAPAEAAAGSTVSVTVFASTDAIDGEEIGFLHADYSTDDGKTWTQFCYAMKSGPELSRQVDVPVGAKGVKAIIRVRVAFRGGKAGDVDYKGGPIQWSGTWGKWRTPPAKFAIIYVTGG